MLIQKYKYYVIFLEIEMMRSKAALLSSLNVEGALKKPLKSRFLIFHLRNLPLQHSHHTY